MKVSVVIPTYNRAGLLPRAVESVLGQSYEDFELLVVDDGSTDATDEVMKGFVSPKIRYIKLGQNEGVSAARNRGIMEATGEWISLLDSDDAYLPGALETIATEATKVPASVGMLFFPVELYTDDGAYIGKRGYVPKESWEYHTPTYEDLLMKKDIKNDMHRTYRASLMKQYLYDVRIKDHDTIYYANLAKQGIGCLYVNKSVVQVYAGEEGHLSHSKRDPRAWQYIYSLYFRDHSEALRKNPSRYHAMCVGMALCCFRVGEPFSGLYWLVKSFV